MWEWLKTTGSKIFTILPSYKNVAMIVAWGICLFAVGYMATIVQEFFNLSKMGDYVPGKFITAVSNLMALYCSLILFDIAFGGHSTIHGILDLKRFDCTTEDRKNAMYFLGILAVCSTYLISIGA